MVVALCEIWAPRKYYDVSRDKFALFKMYYIHWVVAAAIVVVYLALLYGVYVPDWDFTLVTSSASDPEVLHVSVLEQTWSSSSSSSCPSYDVSPKDLSSVFPEFLTR